MAAPDILFAMTGDLYRNSRAIKQIRTLAENTWSIHVLSLEGDADEFDLPDCVTVETVPIKQSRGPRFFYEVHSRFSKRAMEIAASCYHASDLYVLPACAKSAAQHEMPYTFDSRELYAHVSAAERRPWITWFWSMVQSTYLPGASAVFTVSKRIAAHLEQEFNIGRPVVVHNVPPRTSVVRSNQLSELAGLEATVPIVLHMGLMRESRGCTELVEAMRDVGNAHLVFLGDGPEKAPLQELSRSLNLEQKISFLKPVPPDRIHAVASGASVGVSLLQDTCLNHRYALPNKLFDYLAAGVPVLTSNLPEIRSIVQGYNVGRIVDQRNPKRIAEELNRMLTSEQDRSTWIRNAERLCETFNWEKTSQRFVKAFRNIVPRTISAGVVPSAP